MYHEEVSFGIHRCGLLQDRVSPPLFKNVMYPLAYWAPECLIRGLPTFVFLSIWFWHYPKNSLETKIPLKQKFPYTLHEDHIRHKLSKFRPKNATWHLVIGLGWCELLEIWCGNSISALMCQNWPSRMVFAEIRRKTILTFWHWHIG
jgi:hypothetical protein